MRYRVTAHYHASLRDPHRIAKGKVALLGALSAPPVELRALN
jgi:hypothetical protein